MGGSRPSSLLSNNFRGEKKKLVSRTTGCQTWIGDDFFGVSHWFLSFLYYNLSSRHPFCLLHQALLQRVTAEWHRQQQRQLLLSPSSSSLESSTEFFGNPSQNSSSSLPPPPPSIVDGGGGKRNEESFHHPGNSPTSFLDHHFFLQFWHGVVIVGIT